MNQKSLVSKKEYPFEGKTLNINGLNYHYVDEGVGEETIIMVHGNPTWSFYYRNLIKTLSPKYRVIVPDHIGCGFSDKPQDYQYTLKNHIDNLVKLIEHKEIKKMQFVLHDWGGAIGMGAAQRFSSQVIRFTILNTASFLVPYIPLRINICKIPLFGDIAIRGFNGFAGAAIKMATNQKGGLKGEIKKGFLAPYNNWQNRIATLRFVQDIPMNKKHPTWSVMENMQNNLTVFKDTPMHIFWGMKDWCFNENFLHEWQKYFPDIKIKKYEKAGHYVLEDANPGIMEDISSWINQGSVE